MHRRRGLPFASCSRATIERSRIMARRTHTYAIRLAVEGGGQVKAELVSVGQSGEQSLKRIETGGERASGGLQGLRPPGGAAAHRHTHTGRCARRRRDGRWPRRADRPLDLGRGCDRQDHGQDDVGVEALHELRFGTMALGGKQQTPTGAAAVHPSCGRGPMYQLLDAVAIDRQAYAPAPTPTCRCSGAGSACNSSGVAVSLIVPLSRSAM